MTEERPKRLHEELISKKASLQGNPRAVGEAIDEFSSRDGNHMMTFRGPKIDVSREQLEKMDPKPKTIVELGGYVGRSAIAWGQILLDINGGDREGLKVYTCELDPKLSDIIKDHVEIAGLSDIVEVLVGKSEDSLKKLKSEGTIPHIDMLFIDHFEQYYLPDLQLVEALGLFKKGSLVLADNTDFPGAPAYLVYVRAGGSGGPVKLKTETLETKTESSRGPVGHPFRVVGKIANGQPECCRGYVGH